MQKSNFLLSRYLTQFSGILICMVLQVITMHTIKAQVQPSNLTLPYFAKTAGTVIQSTNGNWVTVNPQQPDNINSLETQLYTMPSKGSGLMAVDFELVGADGGTAQYLAYKTNGGQGAKIYYTMSIDSNTAGRPFLVTIGKKGESASYNFGGYCSAGGGGATGMAWVVANAPYFEMNYNSNYTTSTPSYLIGVAAGGGGAFANEIGASGNGQGANSLDPYNSAINKIYANVDLYHSNGIANPVAVTCYAGSSVLASSYLLNWPDTTGITCSSLDHSVLNFETELLPGFTGTVLKSVTFGQGGGDPGVVTVTRLNTAPSALNFGFSFLEGNDIITLTKPGGQGGCGFGGGGAGISTVEIPNAINWNSSIPTGGGGGDGSVLSCSSTGAYPNGGGAGYSNMAPYLLHTSIASVSNTNNPQSGYFAYRTIRDSIPPVIRASHDTLIIGNDNFGFPYSSVMLTPAMALVYDNDSVQSVHFSKTVFDCSDVGTTQTVTVSATDFAGNTTNASFLVTVLDTAHPYIPFLAPPNPFDPGSFNTYDIDVTAGPYTLTATNFPEPESGCDINSTIHFAPTTFTCRQAGTAQTVSFYYTNSAGLRSNVSSKTFNIISQNPAIIYVDASATGANTGNSWADAFTSLQDGINYGCTSNRSIYVAQGTYYPDQGSNEITGDRSASFVIRDSLHVYGGFPSGGGVFNSRNPSAYVTIMDGNIGGQLIGTDNSYHVVTITGNGTVLDGITM